MTTTRIKLGVTLDERSTIGQQSLNLAAELVQDLAKTQQRCGYITVNVFNGERARIVLNDYATRDSHQDCANPIRCTHSYDQMAAMLEDDTIAAVLIVTTTEVQP